MIGPQTTGTILDRIVTQKRFRLDQRLAKISLEQLRRDAEQLKTSPASFAEAIKVDKSLALIAEIKQASPSKGIIAPDFHPQEQAIAYAAAGVQAISVLTEEDFFLGSDEHLAAIRQVVPQPLLRKDFTIDPYQIYEARLLGASAILLIAALLDNAQIRDYSALAHQLGLSVLVEIHTLEELMRALDCAVPIIGINNRDLKTFQVDLAVTEKLARLIPQDRIIVSESGIVTAHDMARVYRAGAQAVLIGETLMRSAQQTGEPRRQVESAIRELYCELPGVSAV